MSGYVKTFKVKDGDKHKNNKLTIFHIDDHKLLENYKTIWTKIEDLKKVYTNFCGLNVPEHGVECESFTIISTNSLLVYENKLVYEDRLSC